MLPLRAPSAAAHPFQGIEHVAVHACLRYVGLCQDACEGVDVPTEGRPLKSVLAQAHLRHVAAVSHRARCTEVVQTPSLTRCLSNTAAAQYSGTGCWHQKYS